MIFHIKTLHGDADSIRGSQVWLTGESPSAELNTELFGEVVDEDKVNYRTGLKPEHIKTNIQFKTDEVRGEFQKIAKPLIAKVLKVHEQAIDPYNKYFWNPSRVQLRLNSQTLERLYDTDNVEDALFYLNILGGGYPSISPTMDLAFENFNRFYVTTEEEFTEKVSQEKFGYQMEAMAALNDLLINNSTETLTWLSYLTTKVNKGYLFNTSKKTYQQVFMDYLDGNSGLDKKKAAEQFYELVESFKKNKDKVIGEAVVAAAIYHGVLYKNKGAGSKYTNILTGDELGSNATQVYQKLMKPEYTEQYKDIFEEVKKKLT